MNKKLILGLVVLFTMLLSISIVSARYDVILWSPTKSLNYTNTFYFPKVSLNITNATISLSVLGSEVNISYQINGAALNSTTTNITNVTDQNYNFTVGMIYNDGGSFIVGNQTNFTLPFRFSHGDTINITVNMTGGNLTIHNFTIDTSNASVYVRKNMTYVNYNQTLQINATITDTGSNISNSLVKIGANGNDQVSMLLANGSFGYSQIANASSLGCSDNANCTIYLNATDYAGNVNRTESITIMVDSNAPNITSGTDIIINDSDKWVLPSTRILLTALVQDLGTVASNLSTIEVGNVSYQAMSASSVGDHNYSIDTTATTLGVPGTGMYRIQINATDRSRNSNTTANVTIFVDGVAPNVTSIEINGSLASGQNKTSSEHVNFAVTVNDGNVYHSNITYAYVGTSSTNLSMNITEGYANYSIENGSLSGLGCSANAACTLTIRAFDLLSNANTSESVNVFVDDINPLVTSILINDTASGSVYVKSDARINVSAVVDDSSGSNLTNVTAGVAGHEYILVSDKRPFSGTYANETHTAADLGCTNRSGTCTINISATDFAGNTNRTEQFVVFVDDYAPNVTNLKVNDTAYGTATPSYNVSLTSEINLSAQLNDTNSSSVDGSMFSTVYAGANGTNILLSVVTNDVYGKVTNASSLGCAGDSDGHKCIIKINTTDNAGNVNATETIEILVDTENPRVTALTLQNDTDKNVTVSQLLIITATINDSMNGSNISTVSVAGTKQVSMIYGTNTNETGGNWSARTTATALGCVAGATCTLTVNATDYAGNNNLTTTINVDVASENAPTFESWDYNSVTKNLTLTFNETMNATTIQLARIHITYPDGVNVTNAETLTGATSSLSHAESIDISLTSSQYNALDAAVQQFPNTLKITMEAAAINGRAGAGMNLTTGTNAINSWTRHTIRRPATYGDYFASTWTEFSLAMNAINNVTAAGTVATTNVTNVLASMEGNYSVIYAYNKTSGGWLAYSPSAVANTFGNFSSETESRDYLIYLTTSEALEIE